MMNDRTKIGSQPALVALVVALVLAVQVAAMQTTLRASVAVDGTQGNGHTGIGLSDDKGGIPPTPSIAFSRNGRFTAFHSVASNLVAADTNNLGDVFVKDLLTGAVVRATTNAAGAQVTVPADPGDPAGLDMDPSGRFVAMAVPHPLSAADVNTQAGEPDIYPGLCTRSSPSLE